MVGDSTDGHTDRAFDGEVGFGFETGTFLGTVGDVVSYTVTVRPPVSSNSAVDAGGETQTVIEACHAGVKADAVNGFTYGKRLVYDWRFERIGPRRTKVELDMFFQARSVLYMPLWDSMQNMVVNGMLGAFTARAEK